MGEPILLGSKGNLCLDSNPGFEPTLGREGLVLTAPLQPMQSA